MLLNKLIVQIRVACIRKCHMRFHVHHSKFKQVRRKELKWAWKWQGVKTESRGKNLRSLVHVLHKTFQVKNLKLLSKNFTQYERHVLATDQKSCFIPFLMPLISLHIQALAYVGCCFSLLREGTVRIYMPAYQASRSYPCGCLIPL